ncbi:hypothetical protein ACHAPU_011501 [Fusarium lateritium]
MRFTQFLTGALAIGFGAQEVLGLSHGKLTEYNGKTVRWQELAEGFFTGVPAETWDDKLHKRSSVQWDLHEITANTTSVAVGLDSRDLKGTRKAVARCVLYSSQYSLLLAYNVWISAAEYASSGQLMEFLNQPFIANALGVAVAGTISGKILEATKKECSTQPESTEADIVRTAVGVVIDKKHDTQDISVDVTGPSGTFNVKTTAGAPNTSFTLQC